MDLLHCAAGSVLWAAPVASNARAAHSTGLHSGLGKHLQCISQDHRSHVQTGGDSAQSMHALEASNAQEE